ncbi:MAG: hypothetical protein BWZ10_00099 [candidate division BRC1 bacterium ADurb.BinA364]|nr:MAG: hypothetical protein BWZ10_00099 [candidate division BRC1 bacterium ADurb.BinA364]
MEWAAGSAWLNAAGLPGLLADAAQRAAPGRASSGPSLREIASLAPRKAQVRELRIAGSLGLVARALDFSTRESLSSGTLISLSAFLGSDLLPFADERPAPLALSALAEIQDDALLARRLLASAYGRPAFEAQISLSDWRRPQTLRAEARVADFSLTDFLSQAAPEWPLLAGGRARDAHLRWTGWPLDADGEPPYRIEGGMRLEDAFLRLPALRLALEGVEQRIDLAAGMYPNEQARRGELHAEGVVDRARLPAREFRGVRSGLSVSIDAEASSLGLTQAMFSHRLSNADRSGGGAMLDMAATGTLAYAHERNALRATLTDCRVETRTPEGRTVSATLRGGARYYFADPANPDNRFHLEVADVGQGLVLTCGLARGAPRWIEIETPGAPLEELLDLARALGAPARDWARGAARGRASMRFISNEGPSSQFDVRIVECQPAIAPPFGQWGSLDVRLAGQTSPGGPAGATRLEQLLLESPDAFRLTADGMLRVEQWQRRFDLNAALAIADLAPLARFVHPSMRSALSGAAHWEGSGAASWSSADRFFRAGGTFRLEQAAFETPRARISNANVRLDGLALEWNDDLAAESQTMKAGWEKGECVVEAIRVFGAELGELPLALQGGAVSFARANPRSGLDMRFAGLQGRLAEALDFELAGHAHFAPDGAWDGGVQFDFNAGDLEQVASRIVLPFYMALEGKAAGSLSAAWASGGARKVSLALDSLRGGARIGWPGLALRGLESSGAAAIERRGGGARLAAQGFEIRCADSALFGLPLGPLSARADSEGTSIGLALRAEAFFGGTADGIARAEPPSAEAGPWALQAALLLRSLDLAELSERLAPDGSRFTGRASGRLDLGAQGKRLERLRFRLQAEGDSIRVDRPLIERWLTRPGDENEAQAMRARLETLFPGGGPISFQEAWIEGELTPGPSPGAEGALSAFLHLANPDLRLDVEFLEDPSEAWAWLKEREER